MRFYWSYRSLPEMDGLSRPAQDRAWAACRWRPIRDWRMWLGLAFAPLMLPTIVWGMNRLPTDRGNDLIFYAGAVLIVGLPGALWGLLMSQLQFFLTRQCLLQHSHGLCPTCGYDLRATPDRCPECGHVPGVV